jgi:hypothetical protein
VVWPCNLARTRKRSRLTPCVMYRQGSKRRRAFARAGRNAQGHPLAGRSSRHRDTRGEDFLFFPRLINSSMTERCSHASLFSFRSVSDLVRTSHPSGSRRRGFPMGKYSRPWQTSCPRKLSVPRRVQGLRIHRSSGSPFQASNPMLAHGVGVPSDQIIAELSIFEGRDSG